MARAHRYGLWREAVESGEIKILVDRVEDDGSIEADRLILLELGATTADQVRACWRGTDNDDEVFDNEDDHDVSFAETNQKLSPNTRASSSTVVDDLINRVVQRGRRGPIATTKRKGPKDLAQGPGAKRQRYRMAETLERESELGRKADECAVYKYVGLLRKSEAYLTMSPKEQEKAVARRREEVPRHGKCMTLRYTH